MQAYWITPLLLLFSNVFMTFAWYGHLKYKTTALIALPEYIFQVPANRIGSNVYTAVQLKTIQEIISLTVFAVFSVYYLGDTLRWNHLIGFGFLVCAAFFLFGFKQKI